MKDSKIKVTQKFTVGSHSFDSIEKAEKFAAKIKMFEDLKRSNEEKLEKACKKFVPVLVNEEADIFYKHEDYNYFLWKSVLGKELEYLDEDLHVIFEEDYLEKFLEDNPIISSDDFPILIEAVSSFLENHRESFDLLKVIRAIGQIQIEPEYIYN